MANLDKAENALTVVSDIAYVRGLDSNGNSVQISKANLASVLGVGGTITCQVDTDLNTLDTNCLGRYVVSKNSGTDYTTINFPENCNTCVLFIISTGSGVNGVYVTFCITETVHLYARIKWGGGHIYAWNRII